LEVAQLYHDAIIDELLSDPSVWDGSLMRIDTLNPKIAEVIEQYMPVEIGVESEIGRLLTVTRNFEQIQRDLQTQKQAHVLIVRETVHAYAVIGATQHELVYVDPFDPYSRFFASKKNFERIFHPDTFGEVFTTPVRRRESKRKGL
jgi:hypothetical protein